MAEKTPSVASLGQTSPQVAFVFNSVRRILKIPGFPCLMREKTEFLESGEFQDFTVTKLIKKVRKYSNIQ